MSRDFLNSYSLRRLVPQVMIEAMHGDDKAAERARHRLVQAMSWSLIDVARQPLAGEKPWFEFLGFALRHAHAAHGQLIQDLWALWESREKRGGYFVEFGACDGKYLSNTYLLEKNYGWAGIVAEPNPAYHASLAANRSCHVSHACVWKESGQTLDFKVVATAELSTIAGLDPQDQQERSGLRDPHTLVKVPTLTLMELLQGAEAPREIDFLSIDTEGSELDILSAFDFNAYDIRLIAVEHNNTPRRKDIEALLKANGYVQRFANRTYWDDWYVKRR